MFDPGKFKSLVDTLASLASGFDVDLLTGEITRTVGVADASQIKEDLLWFKNAILQGCECTDYLDGDVFITHSDCGASGIIVAVVNTAYSVKLTDGYCRAITICVLTDGKFHIQTTAVADDAYLFEEYDNLTPCESLQEALDLCSVMFDVES